MRIACIIAGLALVSPLAQGDMPADRSPERIRVHVAFLADDLLEGRAAGSRGYDIAARYVATQMALAGLAPGGVDGGWLQPVSMIQGTRVVPAATAAIIRGDERTELEPVTDFLPATNYFGSGASVEAPLVFVGFGISAPEFGYDDFAGVDLAGKVAVVLAGAPESFPASERAHHSREKVREVAARGAVGIVFLNTPPEEARSPWDRAVKLSWVAGMRLVDDDGQPVEAYPELKAGMSLNITAAPALFAGSPKPLEQVWADAAAGRPQAFDLPATIAITTRTALSRVDSANVVGLLEGADPELKNEYVVFTAHLDHLGRGAAVEGDTIYNGALDNASGIAVMLEAARMLAGAERGPKRSLLFVAVTAEERGLLGSKKFAMDPTVPKDAIVADINMDMPVLLYPTAGFTVLGAPHSTLGEVARAAIEAEGLRMEPDMFPEEVLFVRSDQYSFVREGIPAIALKDGKTSTDPTIDAEKVFREHMLSDYHMPGDDLDLPIHWESFGALARVVARIGRAVADAPGRPAWLPGDFFGETFGKREAESPPLAHVPMHEDPVDRAEGEGAATDP